MCNHFVTVLFREQYQFQAIKNRSAITTVFLRKRIKPFLPLLLCKLPLLLP